jgi:CRISPR-associated protein Cas2
MTSEAAHRFLIAYDVPDDRRRTRLAHKLETYGDRIQYSVFVCDLKPARLVRLRATVRDLIQAGEDSVLFCDLGHVKAISPRIFSFIGVERPITPGESIVV